MSIFKLLRKLRGNVFALALAICVLIGLELMFFTIVARPSIVTYYRTVAETLFDDAVTQHNARVKKTVNDPKEQEIFLFAVPDDLPDTTFSGGEKFELEAPRHLEGGSIGLPAILTQPIRCFWHVYCIDSRITLHMDKSVSLSILGLRPLSHIERIFFPRTKDLDGILAGHRLVFVEFYEDGDKKWLLLDQM